MNLFTPARVWGPGFGIRGWGWAKIYAAAWRVRRSLRGRLDYALLGACFRLRIASVSTARSHHADYIHLARPRPACGANHLGRSAGPLDSRLNNAAPSADRHTIHSMYIYIYAQASCTRVCRRQHDVQRLTYHIPIGALKRRCDQRTHHLHLVSQSPRILLQFIQIFKCMIENSPPSGAVDSRQLNLQRPRSGGGRAARQKSARCAHLRVHPSASAKRDCAPLHGRGRI